MSLSVLPVLVNLSYQVHSGNFGVWLSMKLSEQEGGSCKLMVATERVSFTESRTNANRRDLDCRHTTR